VEGESKDEKRYRDVKSMLQKAKDKLASGDLLRALEARDMARELQSDAVDIRIGAYAERKRYEEIALEKSKKRNNDIKWAKWGLIPALLGWAFSASFFALVVCIILGAVSHRDTWSRVYSGIILGFAVIGAICGVIIQWMKVQRLRKED
jgi:hypothetical protein